MSFPFFLRGMLGVLLLFAITIYYNTQSWVSTLVQTVICAVILQAGYFIAVFALVRREARNRKKLQKNVSDQSSSKGKHVSGLPRSEEQ